MAEASAKKRLVRRPWFWAVVAVGAVVAVLGFAVLGDWLVYHNEVHRGISVHGVDLGGMDEEEAIAALDGMVEGIGGVTLEIDGRTWLITPDEVGRSMDVRVAVAEAMAVSRKGGFLQNVATRFKLYRRGQDLALSGTIDQTKLGTALSRVATDLHVTPVNASLLVSNGKIRVIQDADGQDVDTQALAGPLESLFVTLETGRVEIPRIVREPQVRVRDNLAAQREAETMIGAPITLTNHDDEWTLSPEELASWLDFKAEDKRGAPTLIPHLVETRMQAFLAGLAPEVYKSPVDAGFKSDGSEVQVIPCIDGERLDGTATAEALNSVAAETGGRTLEVARTPIEPDFTTADAEATTFDDQLSKYTTDYTGSVNRQQNVRVTTKYATDVFLAPGQEYNFDKQIGPRTEARGYMLAPGITGPNKLEDVLGGGICQVSTTMFNAAFFAGLKVTERHNHSIYINHYPKGRDATVTDGGKNLRFVNDTGRHIWIRGTSNGITTTISIYGTSDGREVTYSVGDFYNVKNPTTKTVKAPNLPAGQTKVIDKGQTGRQLKTNRIVTLPGGAVLHNNVWISTWPMYPVQVAVGTGAAPTPKVNEPAAE